MSNHLETGQSRPEPQSNRLEEAMANPHHLNPQGGPWNEALAELALCLQQSIQNELSEKCLQEFVEALHNTVSNRAQRPNEDQLRQLLSLEVNSDVAAIGTAFSHVVEELQKYHFTITDRHRFRIALEKLIKDSARGLVELNTGFFPDSSYYFAELDEKLENRIVNMVKSRTPIRQIVQLILQSYPIEKVQGLLQPVFAPTNIYWNPESIAIDPKVTDTYTHQESMPRIAFLITDTCERIGHTQKILSRLINIREFEEKHLIKFNINN